MHARNNVAFDRIISKLEILLQHYNCSPSSSHGATNSFKELDASESLSVVMPTQDELLPSVEKINIPSPCAQSLLVEVVTPASDLIEDVMDLPAKTTITTLTETTELLAGRNISVDQVEFPLSKESTEFVIDENSVVHRLSPRREIRITPISKSVNEDASSDEMGVSAMTYMTMGGNVVSLPLFGDATHSFTADASLVCTYPYDPGPRFTTLNRVSSIRDSFQFGQEVLTRTPSQFDKPIELQVINMLRTISVSDTNIITHAFLLPFYACPVIISLITVGGFVDFGISASHTYQLFVERTLRSTISNIVSFQDMKTLVANLQTSLQIFNLTLGSVLFACNTFESLLLDTQGMASLVQKYSAISVECKDFSFASAIELSVVSLGLTKLVDNGHFSPSSFLAVNPLGYIAPPYGYMSVLDFYGLVLLQVLIGKNSMKRIKSIIIDFHKPIMQHASLTQLALIVNHVTKLEYSVHCTCLAICVSLAGLVYGICWRLNQLGILVNGWNGKQVQSDLTSLPSFIGWYETPLQENRLIKVQWYYPKANVNIYIKVVHQIGCILIDVNRVHNLGAKRFKAFSTTKQTSCLLPLENAMSLECCKYSTKKKYVMLEQQPANISKWIHNAKKAWKKIHKVKTKWGDRAIELTGVMSARYVMVVRKFCNHIENMSQHASQSFNTSDSRLVRMEWVSAKLNEVLVLGFNHNIHTFTWLIACQLLEARLSAALCLRIMIQERFGIKVTTVLCVVSILPLFFAKTWCTATSLLQPYNQPHFSTIFAEIRKLMCTKFSKILVTKDVMSVMFGSWLWLLGDNISFLTRESKKWDPGGLSFGAMCCALNLEVTWKYVAIIQWYYLVYKEGKLNLELTLGVTTLSQQLYLNFNLEDK
ncbi:hypothetical protein L195_g030688, partial [Trifolium pratense]